MPGQNVLHAEWPTAGEITFAVGVIYFMTWCVGDVLAVWYGDRYLAPVGAGAGGGCDRPLPLWLLVAGTLGLVMNCSCVVALLHDWNHIRSAHAVHPSKRVFGHINTVPPDTAATHVHVWLLRFVWLVWIVVGVAWVKMSVTCSPTIIHFTQIYILVALLGWIVTTVPLALYLCRPEKYRVAELAMPGSGVVSARTGMAVVREAVREVGRRRVMDEPMVADEPKSNGSGGAAPSGGVAVTVQHEKL